MSIRLIVAEYPSEIWIGWIRVRTAEAEVVEDVIGSMPVSRVFLSFYDGKSSLEVHIELIPGNIPQAFHGRAADSAGQTIQEGTWASA
jgi:hypothetical protein